MTMHPAAASLARSSTRNAFAGEPFVPRTNRSQGGGVTICMRFGSCASPTICMMLPGLQRRSACASDWISLSTARSRLVLLMMTRRG